MANTTGKKFGGRQKGTPNRLTKELRAVLKDLIHEELETDDISDIVNEITSMPGWAAGNSMGIMMGHVSGDGSRWVESSRNNNG